MPHVSRYKLSKRAEEELLKSFNYVLAHIGNGEEMLGFIDAILTPTERVMIAKRLGMIILITEGLSDTQIANTLHVTRMTISKMRLFYETREEGFAVALKKLDQEKRQEALKDLLIKLARYSVRAAGGYVKPGVLD